MYVAVHAVDCNLVGFHGFRSWLHCGLVLSVCRVQSLDFLPVGIVVASFPGSTLLPLWWSLRVLLTQSTHGDTLLGVVGLLLVCYVAKAVIHGGIGSELGPVPRRVKQGQFGLAGGHELPLESLGEFCKLPADNLQRARRDPTEVN